MKISILLPYKENFSNEYAGAVSIFIKDTVKKSKYKKNIFIYGNTRFKKKLLKNYINLDLKKKLFFESTSKSYIESFLKEEKKNVSDIIEIHNRPAYVKAVNHLNYAKKILYFHNDPLQMFGSKSVKERIFLIDNLEKIIFNSNWSKKRFIGNLDQRYQISTRLVVVKQSIDKTSVNLKKKENIITFVGKLNTAKGYDLFGKAVLRILDKYKDWSSIVIGDEPREKIYFNHPRLYILGFKKHTQVLNYFKKASIAVVCSRWDEPFGRSSLEAASRGCAVIISNKGGLPETITDGVILKRLNVNEIYNKIEKLILDKKLMYKLQSNSLKNFFLTNDYISKKIDNIRNIILSKIHSDINKNLKILHITNFNERHFGRLFYNTGKRINNGFVSLRHNVMTISDRDIISNNRKFTDLDGSKKLNDTILKTVRNFKPDLIVLGHADSVKKETLDIIKNNFPKIKIAQWFLDRMDSSWKNNKKRFLDKIDYIDCNFCTTSPDILDFKKKYNIFYMPNPVDPALDNLKNYENDNHEFDFFFAMSHGVHRGTLKKGKFDKRELFVNKLMTITKNIRFNIFGINNIQPVWSDDFKVQISKTKMGLNLSQGKPIKYYSSDRISQLIGNGLLTFIDVDTKLDHFFKKDEVIFYESLKDLSQKIIKYSLDNKLRAKIAKKGRDKYHKYFNSEIIADFIIKKTFGHKRKFYWENF